jgi:hypothetical protein
MQKRLPRSSARQAFSLSCGLVAPVEADGAFAFRDRVIRVLERGLTVAAFVAISAFQFRAGTFQMSDRRLHARLVGGGASGYESRGNGSDDEQGDDETMKFHGSSSLSINRREMRRNRLRLVDS